MPNLFLNFNHTSLLNFYAMINEQSSLLTAILSKLSPADISLKENRLLIAERIEKLMRQNRWSRRHFAILMRREIQPLRAWFGNSYTLTLETITDICQILQISLGDLVAE